MDSHFGVRQEDVTAVGILIDYVSVNDRPGLLRRLIQSLQIDNPDSIQFASNLIASEGGGQSAKKQFVDFLEGLLQHGQIDSASKVCSKHQSLGVALLERAIEAIHEAKSSSDADLEKGHIQSYLAFSRSLVSRLPLGDIPSRLLEACLDLSSNNNKTVSKSALDVLFALFARSSGSDDMHAPEFMRTPGWKAWDLIVGMASSKNNHQAMQGYSLWLRYIISTHATSWSSLITPEYWQLLLLGLRRGDSERRKLCLAIIKLSIAADSDIVSSDVHRQYDRYCTIFETIVLGRYINQIQDCENDLNSLTHNSDLEPRWLYVLLGSGMDSHMQESNRKFIGNWVMRSSLRPTPEFLDFLQVEFIPWAIQGQHFVSSLKKENGILRCIHGNALATFIHRLQNQESSCLADIVVDAIHQRCNTIFAYAVVYLLEGISQQLRSKHMSQIAGVKALPEVARDYVESRTSNVCGLTSESKGSSRREIMEQAALDKCNILNTDVVALEDMWADLEYLENPKRLLMAVPKSIFNPGMVKAASKDSKTAKILADKLCKLHTISFTKAYLFAPLIAAVRQAILSYPNTLSVLPIDDFIIQTMEHLPEPTIDLALEEVTISLTEWSYEDYFGERLSYGFAALLDLISRLGGHQRVVRTLLDHLLARWKAQKVPPPTVSAWKNTLQLQVLLLCFEQCEFSSNSDVSESLEGLFHILTIEPLPRYRYLLEATVVRLIIRFDLKETIIDRLNTKDHHGNPKHLASLMKIATILACREESSIDFAAQLAATFVPLAASSKVVIRHEAQWQVPVLMDHCRSHGWTSIIENPAYVSLDTYIRSLERFSDPPLERRIGNFDPGKDLTLSNLTEGKWFDLDDLESPLTSYEDFIKLRAEGLPPGAAEPCMPLGEKIVRAYNMARGSKVDSNKASSTIASRSIEESYALQTKGTAYLARTLSDPTSHTARPNELIVVGSLVDNLYNLGGLSRVSEIFGAAALTLQNQNVVSNKDFTSVSVSSHLHFPIVQLSASGVPAFLTERKQDGYTIVGIEQTDRSVILGSAECHLPKKVVLVVGSEKEGIPAVVLTECDLLVEIPQVGTTRSLNVQTAVGIVLFEYTRQHQR